MPAFYRQELRDRLGPYADMLSLEEITPVNEHDADDSPPEGSREIRVASVST